MVCPNCEAKYEVPEDAIPETGRDVQCANCGHAWFQMRPRAGGAEPVVTPVVPPIAPPVAPPEPVPEAAPEPEPVIEPVIEPVAEVVVEAEPEPVVEPEPAVAEPVVDAVAAAVAEAEEPAAETMAAAETALSEASVSETAEAVQEAEAEASAVAAGAVPAAYAVDDSVLAILREEAEREAQARRAEVAKPLETQTDLGIESAIPETRKPVEVVAAAVEAETDDKLANRRTRLPDVEEINSTLRPAESTEAETAAGAAPVAAEGRSSFRSGFLLVLTVAILGSAIYGAADSLSQAVPALAGPLKAYVGFVDSLRLHLDGLMQSATVAINGD